MSGIIDFFVSLDIFGHPVGVNYKGSGTYQTKLGAFVTLSIQSLMMFNLVTLCIAYYDRSKQVEVYQATKFDRFLSDQYHLQDNNVTISLLSSTPLTPDIGKFKVMNDKNCKKSEAKCIEEGTIEVANTVECSQEFKEEAARYWHERLPRTFSDTELPGLVCFDHSNLYVQSEPLSDLFSMITIAYEHCIETNTTAEECAD